MTTPPDPATFNAAIATVRKYEAGAAAQWPISSLDPTDEQSAFELLARHFLSLLDAGEVVRVRGLEWKDNGPFSSMAIIAFDLWFHVLQYSHSNEWWIAINGNGYVKSIKCDSLEDGKAKATEWYRSRLAAALEPLLPEVRT